MNGSGLFGFRSHVQTGFGAVQRIQRAVDIHVRIAASQTLFRALFGFARALHVDFGGTFRGLSEDRYFIRQHFCEAPGHGQTELALILAVDNLTDR